jgi:hypothetical protein
MVRVEGPTTFPLSSHTTRLRLRSHGSPRSRLGSTHELSAVGPRRGQPCVSGLRNRVPDMPLRSTLSWRRRHTDAGQAYAVVLPAPSHIRPTFRTAWPSRVRVCQVRSPARLSGGYRPLRQSRPLPQEGALCMRPLWPPGAPGDPTQRLPGVHLFLRAFVSEERAGRPESSTSVDLLLHGASHSLRDTPGRLCRVRVPRLWPSVLFC